jgi:hypothetical protein
VSRPSPGVLSLRLLEAQGAETSIARVEAKRRPGISGPSHGSKAPTGARQTWAGRAGVRQPENMVSGPFDKSVRTECPDRIFLDKDPLNRVPEVVPGALRVSGSPPCVRDQ